MIKLNMKSLVGLVELRSYFTYEAFSILYNMGKYTVVQDNVLNNLEFGTLTTIKDSDNEFWFSGKEIASVLGYSNTEKALRVHVDEEDFVVIKSNDVTQAQNGTEFSTSQRGDKYINESGIYSLVLRSKLPTAKKFKRWVTKEVLPTIRKTGGYLKPEMDWTDLDQIQKVLDVAKEERKKRLDAEIRQLELQKALDNTQEYASIIRVAKHNNMSEKRFEWRELKKATLLLGKQVVKTPCPRYGFKNTYPVDAFRKAYPFLDLDFNDYI